MCDLSLCALGIVGCQKARVPSSLCLLALFKKTQRGDLAAMSSDGGEGKDERGEARRDVSDLFHLFQ